MVIVFLSNASVSIYGFHGISHCAALRKSLYTQCSTRAIPMFFLPNYWNRLNSSTFSLLAWFAICYWLLLLLFLYLRKNHLVIFYRFKIKTFKNLFVLNLAFEYPLSRLTYIIFQLPLEHFLFLLQLLFLIENFLHFYI